jgi:hypothetical protein
MKKYGLLLFLPVIILAFASCHKLQIAGIKKMGTENFTVEKWKIASQEKRGEMIYSFLNKYQVRGMTPEEIKKLLGPSTAYYNYDIDPAYWVGPKRIMHTRSDKSSSILAFPTNKKTGKINSFVIDPMP